jgi:hypothetical protein
MKSDMRTISDLRLEQYVLGELSEAETREVRDALEADTAVRERLEGITRSNKEILFSFPAVRMAPAIEERARESAAPVRRQPFMTLLVPLAAAALAVVSIVGIRAAVLRGSVVEDTTRPKIGELHLIVYRKTADGAEALKNGAGVSRGDTLQIAYVAADQKYGAIFSIDGRGVVTFHLPQDYAGQSQYSPELDQKGEAALPFAYELDDAPAFERFFFVFSKSRFDLRDIRKAALDLAASPNAAASGNLRIASGLGVYSLVLKK